LAEGKSIKAKEESRDKSQESRWSKKPDYRR